jgi:hypothetical protein
LTLLNRRREVLSALAVPARYDPPQEFFMPDEAKGSIWIPLAAGVLGALVGGGVQYYATRSLETEKQLLQIQLGAYADFAKAQAALQRARSQENEATRRQQIEDANLKIRDAAFRVVIFSPVEVVEKLATLTKDLGPQPPEPCHLPSTDIALYQSMRGQALGTSAGRIEPADIAMALFVCQL